MDEHGYRPNSSHGLPPVCHYSLDEKRLLAGPFRAKVGCDSVQGTVDHPTARRQGGFLRLEERRIINGENPRQASQPWQQPGRPFLRLPHIRATRLQGARIGDGVEP